MGKKLQGAKLRAKKRAKAAVEELQEQQAEEQIIAQKLDSSTADEPLIVVDRQGKTDKKEKQSSRSRKAKTAGRTADSDSEEERNRSKNLSEKDRKQVDKLLQTHGVEKVRKMAQVGRQKLESWTQPDKHPRRLQPAQKTNTKYDLWGDNQDKEQDAVVEEKTTTTTGGSGGNKEQPTIIAGIAPPHAITKAKPVSKQQQVVEFVNVDVAKSGQSYRPDPIQHQNFIQQVAAKVEVAREHAVKERDTPISQGMRPETRALLLGDSDSDDSEEEEEESDTNKKPTDDTMAVGAIPKRSNKLTKAQRNKKKRQRVEYAIQREAKRTKKLLNEVSEIPRYKKELKQQERQRQEQKRQKTSKLHQAAAAAPSIGIDLDLKVSQDDPINAPTVPVALSTEVGSLRTIKPKGSLAQDRIHNYSDRKIIDKYSQKPEAVQKRKLSKKKRRVKVKGRKDYVVSSDCEILG